VVAVAFAAVAADHLFEVGEIEVGRVAAEAVAAPLTGEQMVDVATHRFALLEP
jgi:hypothetical protein